jgi:hypothetical protein
LGSQPCLQGEALALLDGIERDRRSQRGIGKQRRLIDEANEAGGSRGKASQDDLLVLAGVVEL